MSTIFRRNDVLQQQLIHILDEITTSNDKQLPFLGQFSSLDKYRLTMFTVRLFLDKMTIINDI